MRGWGRSDVFVHFFARAKEMNQRKHAARLATQNSKIDYVQGLYYALTKQGVFEFCV
ncbi:MAG: hypothetical protein G01um101416_297 [Microgenomates group bacterium Gr01-1014_16]|nr:MAG: hypothetical protein G01um101416_297 [Microgenomates group bacterium Gr01-1014_16]